MEFFIAFDTLALLRPIFTLAFQRTLCLSFLILDT